MCHPTGSRFARRRALQTLTLLALSLGGCAARDGSGAAFDPPKLGGHFRIEIDLTTTECSALIEQILRATLVGRTLDMDVSQSGTSLQVTLTDPKDADYVPVTLTGSADSRDTFSFGRPITASSPGCTITGTTRFEGRIRSDGGLVGTVLQAAHISGDCVAVAGTSCDIRATFQSTEGTAVPGRQPDADAGGGAVTAGDAGGRVGWTVGPPDTRGTGSSAAPDASTEPGGADTVDAPHDTGDPTVVVPAPPPEGTFFAGLATSLAPGAPLLFLLGVDPGAAGTLDLTLQPLAVADRKPVGPPITALGVELTGGTTFVADLGTISIPAAANPISGTPIAATVTLHGTVRDAATLCGSVSGMVTSPLTATLTGSTFGAIKVASVTALPADPLTACPGQ